MKRRLILVILAVVVLVGVIVMNGVLIEHHMNQQITAPLAEVAKTEVSVVTVAPAAYQSLVTGYGAATAHYALSLTAQVAGEVQQVNPLFEAGQQVASGTVLAQLEDSSYKAAVAEAESTLATANVSLLEELREGEQALREWQASGMEGEPDSELVLRQPQRQAAQAAVSQAEAALVSARQDLADTRIVAPFAAVVISRAVAPGQFIQEGGEVATLYSTDRVEISIALSAKEWKELPDVDTMIEQHWPVDITRVEDHSQWQGYVIRSEQHMDETTRQQALIIAVDQPLQQSIPLLAGTFVTVQLDGRTIEGLWQLPASALSQRGEIWYVTEQHTLDCFSAEARFSRNEMIYVEPPTDLAQQPQQVLSHPLSSYTQGMAVTWEGE
nr:efflux RND transporter periplasmic adaptor subunit [uncultured Desulfuromonas sp.]